METFLCGAARFFLFVLPFAWLARADPPPEEDPPIGQAAGWSVSHIKFDHARGQGMADALDIRLDFANDLQHAADDAGEWVKGRRNEAALYVANKAVTLKVRIVAPLNVASADIEARAVAGGIRNLNKRNVTFDNQGVSIGPGNTAYVSFTPDGNTSLTIRKVVDSFSWRASNIRLRGGGVQAGPFRIDVSGPHTTYTVVDLPTAPWYANVNAQPWVSALEFTIVTAGADGKRTAADAAAAITDFVFGGYGLQYDNLGFGTRGYTAGAIRAVTFDLTRFMTKANGIKVNCDDVAASMHSMINLMGGNSRPLRRDLWGYMNQAALIGHGACNNPFFGANLPMPNPAGVPVVDPRKVVGVDDTARDADADGDLDRTPFSYHSTVLLLPGNAVYEGTFGPNKNVGFRPFLRASIDTSTAAERAATRLRLQGFFAVTLR